MKFVKTLFALSMVTLTVAIVISSVHYISLGW